MAQRRHRDDKQVAETLGAALGYGELEIPVFRLRAIKSDGTCTCGRPDCDAIGKHPAGNWRKRGPGQATTDPDAIERMFGLLRGGIGAAVGGQFLVLDFDPKNGGLASRRKLESAHGMLPKTTEIASGEYDGQRGAHVWFLKDPTSYVPSRPLSAFEGFPSYPGIDVKADGGMVVMPPSIHKSGVAYEIVIPFEEMIAAPAWLIEHLTREAPSYEEAQGRVPTGRPLSQEVRRYLRDGGIPVGEQRFIACRIARALLEVPYDVETTAEAIFGALGMSDEDESKGPWTFEECLGLVSSIDRSPRPKIGGRR